MQKVCKAPVLEHRRLTFKIEAISARQGAKFIFRMTPSYQHAALGLKSRLSLQPRTMVLSSFGRCETAYLM